MSGVATQAEAEREHGDAGEAGTVPEDAPSRDEIIAPHVDAPPRVLPGVIIQGFAAVGPRRDSSPMPTAKSRMMSIQNRSAPSSPR